jgi:RNA polymerase primary sigma factor
MSIDEVDELLRMTREPTSLDSPVGTESDARVADFVPDEQAEDPRDLLEIESLQTRVGRALATLDPREEKVLRLRFGLDDDETRSLEQIGREFGLTRERIRQIEIRALAKLRHSKRAHYLADFANNPEAAIA